MIEFQVFLVGVLAGIATRYVWTAVLWLIGEWRTPRVDVLSKERREMMLRSLTDPDHRSSTNNWRW